MAWDGIRGDPWFDDGNILLVTQESPTAFRVHRGVLGRHSEVFEGMFSIPQPSSNSNIETFEGCQVVPMYDLPSDLSSLIKALYDGANFRNRNFEDFAYLTGILRLSTKYFIGHLRTQAIRFLTETWPYSLKGHDAMVTKALATPSSNGLTFPYVHPLHVLNLAHEVNVRIVIPPALYFLSLYPLADILRGDHPKLKVQHPSSPSSSLDPTDTLSAQTDRCPRTASTKPAHVDSKN
ncbi:putative BTB/POZ domain containing protein [Lyophyllum shimeji]|uniref:BTB/POZ domain containing protein n=1 Tax=Lyophyllum shimeji TaxID=47721 RepID=A0A9P3UMF6_LYOSH|nr:putative BTB/POZ domain containing protein [Lyophyllum shimeji]